jgi:hypothetical protein
LSHTFNYYLPVYDNAGEKVMYRVWTLDSGISDVICPGAEEGDGYDCIRKD